jgi:hypothetical protein
MRPGSALLAAKNAATAMHRVAVPVTLRRGRRSVVVKQSVITIEVLWQISQTVIEPQPV